MSVARGNRGNRIWNTDPTDLGVRESASVMYTRESMPPRELVFGVTDVTESFSNPDSGASKQLWVTPARLPSPALLSVELAHASSAKATLGSIGEDIPL